MLKLIFFPQLQNKCNVGYAFINMLSPLLIIPFYEVCMGIFWLGTYLHIFIIFLDELVKIKINIAVNDILAFI